VGRGRFSPWAQTVAATWALAVFLLLLIAPTTVQARGTPPEPTPVVPPTEEPAVPPVGGPVAEDDALPIKPPKISLPNPAQIIKHILLFPVKEMQEATEQLLVNILNANAEALRKPFAEMFHAFLLRTFPIMGKDSVFEGTWGLTMRIAAALWPATLALMMAAAARNEVTGALGIGGWKDYLLTWFGGVVFSALSLHAINLFHRLVTAMSLYVITAPVGGIGGVDVEFIVNTFLLISPFTQLEKYGPPPAIILMVALQLILGFVALLSLGLQYFARMALLYVLIALAPVVIVLGVLPPLRWLYRLWLKGLVMVELLLPMSLLLLKLLIVLDVVIVKSWGGVGPWMEMIVGIGVVSLLISMNGAVVKGVFGAAAVVLDNVARSAVGVAAMATGMVGALASVSGGIGGGGGVGTATPGLGAGGAVGTALPGAGVGGSSGAAGGSGGTAGGGAASSSGGGGETTPAGGQEAGAASAAVPSGGGGTTAQAHGGGGKTVSTRVTEAVRAGSRKAAGAMTQAARAAGNIEQAWRSLPPSERMRVVGAGLQAAGRTARPGGLARGLLTGAGNALTVGGRPGRTPRLSPGEAQALGRAVGDLRRTYGPLAKTAGVNLDDAVNRALGPALKRAEGGEGLQDQAVAAGFGGSASPVEDYARWLAEQELARLGVIDGPSVQPRPQDGLRGGERERPTDASVGSAGGGEERRQSFPLTVAGWGWQLARVHGGDANEYAGRLMAVREEAGHEAAERLFRAALSDLNALYREGES